MLIDLLKRYFPYFLLLIFLGACSASKRTTALWTATKSVNHATSPEVLPTDFSLYRLDVELLVNSLKEVGSSKDEGIFVQFPDPEGTMNSFKVWRSSVVSEALLTKYPNLRAYQGFSITDGSDLRMELPTEGFHAMVNAVGRTWFIAPYDKEQQLYMTYYKSDYPSNNKFWEGRIK